MIVKAKHTDEDIVLYAKDAKGNRWTRDIDNAIDLMPKNAQELVNSLKRYQEILPNFPLSGGRKQKEFIFSAE